MASGKNGRRGNGLRTGSLLRLRVRRDKKHQPQAVPPVPGPADGVAAAFQRQDAQGAGQQQE